MIAIIDYDAGNVGSVEKALKFLGQDVTTTRDAEKILAADKVILPGVGAFGDAMEKLRIRGFLSLESVWAFSCYLKEAMKRRGQKDWGY